MNKLETELSGRQGHRSPFQCSVHGGGCGSLGFSHPRGKGCGAAHASTASVATQPASGAHAGLVSHTVLGVVRRQACLKSTAPPVPQARP